MKQPSFLNPKSLPFKALLLCFVFIALIGTQALAVSITWKGAHGANGTRWNVESNWSIHSLPTAADNVIIPNTDSAPVITTGAICNSLTINSEASLTINSGGSLTVMGSWTNNGTFIQNSGTVTFSGGSDAEITGNAKTTFTSLKVNKGHGKSAEINLNGKGKVDVTNSLTIDNGLMKINRSGALNLSGTAIAPSSGIALNGGTYTVNGVNITTLGSKVWVSQQTGKDKTNWNIGDNWSPSGVPLYTDDVIINIGTSVNQGGQNPIVASAAVCNSITINTGGNLTINTGGSLAVSGNWTNNGTFIANSGTVTFSGANSATISGNSATAFYNITVNKGTDGATVLEANGIGALSNSNNITITSGLFKMTTGTWTGLISPIPSTGGIHINGATFSSGSFTNNGLVRISSGKATFGSAAGSELTNSNNAWFDFQGGTVNFTGRLNNTANATSAPSGNWYSTYGVSISGTGTLTVATLGNANSTTASFHMSATSNFGMTGGTVAIQTPNSNSTPFNDLQILSGGTKSITGGTFQIGNSSTQVSKVFLINSGVSLANLTINNTNSPTVLLASNLNLSGSFLNGSILDAADKTLTLGSSTTNNGTIKFSGASNGLAIPTTGKIEYYGTSAQNITAGTYNNLTTSGSGAKTIASGSAVSLTGTLTVNNGSTLTIASTAKDATGSLIVGGTSTINGTVKVQRWLPTEDWHLISSPVSGQTLNNFAASNGIQLDGSTQTYDIGPYNEGTDLWDYTSQAESFAMAKGYSTERTLSAGGGLATFTGTGIYTGSQAISIPRANFGWNCIGNPYTSAILATGTTGFLGVNGSQLDPAFASIYIWDNAYSDYQTITNSGTQYLAVGQGFIVKANAGGGSIVFNSNMQVHQNGATFKDAEIPWPAVTLKAETADFRSKTVVNFNEAMTTGLDPTYDAGMFKGNQNIALYTKLVSGDSPVDFSVQSLPPSETGSYRIPVGLDLPAGGEVRFTAATLNLPVGTKVIMEDAQTQTFTELGPEGAQYTTVVAANTSGTGRFYLHTGENSVTGLSKLDKQDFTVFTRDRIIYINGEAGEGTGFSLYNIEGKQFANLRAKKLNQNTIDAKEFPTGVYFLRINNNGHQQVAKLVLMN